MSGVVAACESTASAAAMAVIVLGFMVFVAFVIWLGLR